MVSSPYQKIQRKIEHDECVLLDGGVSTELQHIGLQDHHLSDADLWGTWALYHAPHVVQEVHKQYASVGCDLISTNTWGILEASAPPRGQSAVNVGPKHWMDVARLGVSIARTAIEETGRTGQCAVAFSVSGNLDLAEKQDTLRLLDRALRDSPPDLILVETQSLVPDDLSFPGFDILVQTGLPVWLSYRRCRHGVCGVYGQHWGGPEGDLFGRAARKFEDLGIQALLINCLPFSHLPGMLPWLRDFTDLPLGVYPNLGHYLDPDWKFDDQVGPEDFATLAKVWREEGAQIIGGCCGVTPEHIKATGESLQGTRPGTPDRAVSGNGSKPQAKEMEPGMGLKVPAPWNDTDGRTLYPLPFPEIICDPGVFRPTPGSFMVWKYLFKNHTGKGLKCLEVGCGTGLLSIQLALNEAKQVLAIDVQKEAVANTLTNAFRNDVSDRVSGRVVDLYAWLPEDKYELIVASLYQMPVDPRSQMSGHRPMDYWGRNLMDHLIKLLPGLLEKNGVAYILHTSILSQLRTAELMEEAGLQCRIADFAFFTFNEVFNENLDQIQQVEQQSDAYHLAFGEHNEMVVYLLEATLT